MREILFRGKRIDNDEWIEGSLVHRTQFYGEPDDRYFILYDGEFHCDYYDSSEVDFKTVGQYTGLTDKNGKKIFEGDIVKHINVFEEINSPEIGVVVYEQDECCFEIQRTYKNPENVQIPTSTSVSYIIPDNRNLYEIIGNIHDNPELVGGGDG